MNILWISLPVIFISIMTLSLIFRKKLKVEEQRTYDFLQADIKAEDPGKHMQDFSETIRIDLPARSSRYIFPDRRYVLGKLNAYYKMLRIVPETLIDVVPSAQWIIDNFYIIKSEIQTLGEYFSRNNCRKLPSAKNGPLRHYPVIYTIAWEMLRISNFHLDENNIVHLINSCQKSRSLTIAELWAIQSVLKICIIKSLKYVSDTINESIKLKQKVNKIVRKFSREVLSSQQEIMSLFKRKLTHSELANSQVIAHILLFVKEYGPDDSEISKWLHGGLSSEYKDLQSLLKIETQTQAKLELKMSSLVSSLIELESIDWRLIFAKISKVEEILANDPAMIYSRMDFDTKDSYHHGIEIIAKKLKIPETEIAKRAVLLAAGYGNHENLINYRNTNDKYNSKNSGSLFHIGYFIIGKKRTILEKSFGYEPGILDKLSEYFGRKRGWLYFMIIGVVWLALMLFILLSAVSVMPLKTNGTLPTDGLLPTNGILHNYSAASTASLLILSPAFSLAILLIFASMVCAGIAIDIANNLLLKLYKPKKLPSMDFEKEIPDDSATVVVIPVLISNCTQAAKHIENMEVYYLANKSRNLYFALLADFKDAGCSETADDAVITDYCSELTDNLNTRYSGPENSIFFFFCRKRIYNHSENCWMGWERKRGKLEEFNRFLCGDLCTSYSILKGNIECLKNVRYVITIDADTELPMGSAARLAGIMAHPMNKPALNDEGNTVLEGYTIVQPRIGIHIGNARVSLFSKVISGKAGLDPYVNAVSDIYQDLFEEGIFTGKGIYDLRTFHTIMDKSIPENSILSHDLLEGSLTRCALASNVELLDSCPSNVISFFKREHRWIRGDWQLLPWLVDKNRLNGLSRWKIADNLRRSILPAFTIGFIFSACILFKFNILVLTFFVLFGTLFSLTSQLISAVVFTIKKINSGTVYVNLLPALKNTLQQCIIMFSLIPYKAYIAIDAIIRTIYRLYISHRKLLEWQTAEATENSPETGLPGYISKMWTAILTGFLLLITALLLLNYAAIPIGLIWMLSPFIAYFSSKPRRISGANVLNENQENDCRVMADKIWHYFDELSEKENNWLCPDNYQELPGNTKADRTSPTNIGLQLTALVCACDMNFIKPQELLEKAARIFDTLDKLAKWYGHLYNWYNIRTLEVLRPYYVSTADSGNFIASLIVLKNALRKQNYMRAEQHDRIEAEQPILFEVEQMVRRIDNWITSTDFSVLYNSKKNLFHIGYNVAENKPDRSCYDLFASEARLASLIAISKKDVPAKHWFCMRRPLAKLRGDVLFLSWNGTMFEYMLPQLFIRNFPGSAISETCKVVALTQMRYGIKRRIPWGISESGYYKFDRQLNYQYRAFGVPGLGFQTQLRKSLVIAPYASLIAIEILPREVLENLNLLRAIGAEGMYGFYEAIDYLVPNVRDIRSFNLVRSYMAHHLGMSMIALDNIVNGGKIHHYFHSEPIIKGSEFLLEEIWSDKMLIKGSLPGYNAPDRGTPVVNVNIPRTITSAWLKYPTAHILSNNNYAVMLTSSGSSMSFCDGLLLNRWRPYLHQDNFGTFIYIRNITANELWSAAFLPAVKEPDSYNVRFTNDKAEYRRRDGMVETVTEVVVTTLDNMEIRILTLINHGRDEVKLSVASYFEPVIDTYRADLAHPAFSKLFIASEFIEEYKLLLAHRRPRAADSDTKYVFHGIVAGEKNYEISGVQYETDRQSFIGRQHDTSFPESMENINQYISPRTPVKTGRAIDTAMSLRCSVVIQPDRSYRIVFITGIADDKKKAVELAARYQSMHVIEDACKMALFDSQIEMQYLKVDAIQVNAIQNLVSALYYTIPMLRGPATALARNRLGQKELWRFGISGDNPILLSEINNQDEIPSLRDMLLAYQYLRKNGLNLDLVILYREEDGYLQPLYQRINDLIAASRVYYPNLKGSGIFPVRRNGISEDEVNLLLTVARVVFKPSDRLLSKFVQRFQQEEWNQVIYLKPLIKNMQYAIYENRQLKNIELDLFNSFGGFTKDGREYVILLNDKQTTPAPWCNIIANERFGFIVSESGAGYTWFNNSRQNKLTTWYNDPVAEPHSEIIYFRDNETCEIFSATPGPVRDRQLYRIRHGFGYSVFEHSSNGIIQRMSVVVADSDPVKLTRITLTNNSGRTRCISVYYYVEWVLGISREETEQYVTTSFIEDEDMLIARNTYNNDYKYYVAFTGCSDVIDSYTCDALDFMGHRGHKKAPEGVYAVKLSNRSGAGLSPCSVIKTDIVLKEDEVKNIVFVLGQAASEMDAAMLLKKYRNNDEVTVTQQRSRAFWEKLLGQIRVRTPDKTLNVIFNGWLLYQVISCRLWARSSYYQCGGAFGFRDQLQDVIALLHTRPEMCREHIIRCCGRQYEEGDVQHWWHEDSGWGVRTRVSDDLLWLPYTTAEYISNTEDWSILDEKAAYISDMELGPKEYDRYNKPPVSEKTDDVYGHCIAAIERAMRFGPHGLPLMGGGDWNDGMNKVGLEGRGESVWLGWFMLSVLKKFIPICKMRNDYEKIAKYGDQGERMLEALEKYCWDGKWYLRAFYDNGSMLGSDKNEECRIDSISQSWAVISGAADIERAKMAMMSVEQLLYKPEEKMLLLLAPPFNKGDPDPGYIKGYMPGVRENGGQYSHAAVWNVIAFAMMGEGRKAIELFDALNPLSHSRKFSDAQIYAQEPYVMSGDVYWMPPYTGRGGWSWYTGSAGWMYQAVAEHILGLKRRGNLLYVEPVIPDKWKSFEVDYRFGEATYHIAVENPGMKPEKAMADADEAKDGTKYRILKIEIDGVQTYFGEAMPDGTEGYGENPAVNSVANSAANSAEDSGADSAQDSGADSAQDSGADSAQDSWTNTAADSAVDPVADSGADFGANSMDDPCIQLKDDRKQHKVRIIIVPEGSVRHG